MAENALTRPAATGVAAPMAARTDGPPALSPRPDLRAPVLGGILVIGLFFGLFGTWAVTASLSSAAVAPGVVSVAGSKKVIQHLEGGIVRSIAARDGDVVAADQVLVTLEDTQARSAVQTLRSRRDSYLAEETRLVAERDGLKTLSFPPELTSRMDDPAVRSILTGQENMFRARLNAQTGQQSILEQQIAQFQEEISGLQEQISSENRQIALIEEEIRDLETLNAQGLGRKPRLLEKKREASQIAGSRAAHRSEIARTRQSIGETQIRINEIRTEFLNSVISDLRDVQSQLFEVREQLRSAEDVLRRTVIRAPIAGTIVNSTVFTDGGVIRPGEPLMEMVPTGDKLIVEARVQPSDIDVVSTGLTAEVRLSAFSQRSSAPVKGRVIGVSADGIEDEKTGETYYLTRIELTEDIGNVIPGAILQPGMQAEVLIVTGERTFMDYVTQPLLQSFQKSLRE
ncbi:MAG: HlyD family type I secretion periplasmic adaptor subunit [Rhodospirillales bacterium]